METVILSARCGKSRYNKVEIVDVLRFFWRKSERLFGRFVDGEAG